jgi:mitochondrial pyruvate carrier 2
MFAQKLNSLWNHPAGPKTSFFFQFLTIVFFWAPMMKWSLVIAGIADLKKPAEDISTAQTSALTATGLIWARFVFNFFKITFLDIPLKSFQSIGHSSL